jgi:hypothetical protein
MRNNKRYFASNKIQEPTREEEEKNKSRQKCHSQAIVYLFYAGTL